MGRVLGNASWVVAESLVSLFLGFFISIWVIRYLGPRDFGRFSYSISVIAILTTIGSLGLKDIVVRELVNSKLASPGRILSSAAALQILGGLGACGIAYIFTYLTDADAVTRILVMVVSLELIVRPFNISQCWFHSQVLAKYVVMAKIASVFASAALRVVLIILSASVVAFAVAHVISVAVMAFGLILALKLRGPKIQSLRPDLSVAKTLLRDGWPLILSALSIGIFQKIDQVMLGELATKHEVGIYATAARLSEVLYVLPMALGTSVFPAIVKAREQNDKSRYNRKLQLLFDAMGGSSFLLVVPLSLLAGPIINFIFGEAYTASASIFATHVWAYFFVALGVARTQWLIAEGYTRFKMVSSTLGALSNVGMNLWLIPLYGGMGAAWATVVSYSLSAFWSGLLIAETRPILKQQTLALLAPVRAVSIARELRLLLSRT